jgi:hypothetical protein
VPRAMGGERESKARGKVQEPLDNKAKVSVKYLWNWVSVCTLCSFGQKKRKKKRKTRTTKRKEKRGNRLPKNITTNNNLQKNINNQLQTKYQLPYF